MPTDLQKIFAKANPTFKSPKDEIVSWKTVGQDKIKIQVNSEQKKIMERVVPENQRKLDLTDKHWLIPKKYFVALKILLKFENQRLLEKWLKGQNISEPVKDVEKTANKEKTAPTKTIKKVAKTASEGSKITRSYIDAFNYKKAPFGHQKDFLETFFCKEKMILADDQGLGKSFQAIHAALMLKEKENIKHVLIVCGVNSLKYNWANEIELFSDETYTVIEGSTQKKIKLLNEKSFFKIVNIEALRKKEILDLMLKKKFDLCVFDEIHKAKNPQSKQGKNLLKLNYMRWMLGLTGTPLINKPLDLFVPLKWLGAVTQSFWSFRKTYAELDYYGNPVKYKNLNILKSVYDENSLRRTKKQVLDLPEKVFSYETLDFSKEQYEIYRMIRDNCIKEMRDEYNKNINTSNLLAKLTRLRQVATDPTLIDPNVTGVKIERMIELAEETVENGNKVVIFVNWIHAAENIYNIFKNKKYGPVMITGKVPLQERSKSVKDFQENPDCKICIGTYKAMGTGLTLTAANTVFLIDKPWTYADLIQGIDRCHRIGQKQTTYVVNFKIKKSVDDVVEAIIETKKNLTDFANEKFTPEDLDKFISML